MNLDFTFDLKSEIETILRNNTDLRIFRFNHESHPIFSENYKIRFNYFASFYTLLKRAGILTEKVTELVELYFKCFSIKPEDYSYIKNIEVKSDADIDKILAKVSCYYYKKLGFINIKRINFKYLFAVDIICAAIYTEKVDTAIKIIQDLFNKLRFRKKEFILMVRLSINLLKGDISESKFILDNLKSSRFEMLIYFYNRFKNDVEIQSKKVLPINVIATMSAGKSTLINALLGQDIVTAKNEACTSKPLIITQNNYMDRYFGYALKNNNEKIYDGSIDASALSKWNEEDSIKSICIEGSMTRIYNESYKIELVDMPGPNSSVNKEHKKIAYDIIENSKTKAAIYVINATQLFCNDDQKLIQKIKEKINKKHILCNNIVFVLNKMDTFDLETGESIETAIADTNKYLKENGIVNVSIIPVSAYACKLFRTAIKGYKLSRKEKVDCLNLLDIFSDESYNLNNYALVNKSYANNNTKFSTYSNEDKVSIGDNNIKVKDLYQAINRTGIMLLEDYVSKMMIDK